MEKGEKRRLQLKPTAVATSGDCGCAGLRPCNLRYDHFSILSRFPFGDTYGPNSQEVRFPTWVSLHCVTTGIGGGFGVPFQSVHL